MLIFTIAEIEALYLAAWCKDIPINCTETIKAEIITLLCNYNLLRKSKSGLSYRATPLGYELLSKAGYPLKQDKTYLGKSDALSRRLHIAEIILFIYRIFGNVFQNTKSCEISFVPSFIFRRKEAANLLGGNRLTGFLYTPNVTYILYYIAHGNDGLYPTVEERTIMGSGLHRNKEIRIIYTGQSDLPSLIKAAGKPAEKKQKSTTLSFLDSMDVFGCPVYFVPLSEMGARQFRIICQPNYEIILARHLLGNEYRPAVFERYHALHKTTGEPFIIGIGCNLKSFDQATSGEDKPIHIILFQYQISAVKKMLAGLDTVLHPIDIEDAEKVLGIPHDFCSQDDSPCRTPEGGFIHAPSFKGYRKSGEKN